MSVSTITAICISSQDYDIRWTVVSKLTVLSCAGWNMLLLPMLIFPLISHLRGKRVQNSIFLSSIQLGVSRR
jgi:hypothetical protein